MKWAVATVLALAVVTTALLAQSAGDSRGSEPAFAEAPAGRQARTMLDAYCVGCHNEKVRTAGIAFDSLPLTAVHDNADVWEKALRKLRGRQMPPPGSRQPDQREIDAFASWLEGALDEGRLKAASTSAASTNVGAAFRRPLAGHVPIRRLTRPALG